MRFIVASVFAVFSLFVFSSCGGAAPQAVSPADDQVGADSVATDSGESKAQIWTINVNDTSTINIGAMQMDFTINLQAVNTSGKIYGEYVGSATTKAVSHMEVAQGTINAPVEGSTTSLVINVNPGVADDEKLAPLVPEEPDDGKLAPLVPEEPDDGKLAPLVPEEPDALAPLTDPSQKFDFEGSGSMTLVSGGTGTISGGGYSASRALGNTSVNPLKVFITGTTVRLEVDIPEVGPVYFDGTISGGEKNQ